MRIDKLPAVFENHPIATLWLDESLTSIISANKAARNLFGDSDGVLAEISIKNLFDDLVFGSNLDSITTINTKNTGKIAAKVELRNVELDNDKFHLLFVIALPPNSFESAVHHSSSFKEIVAQYQNEVLMVSEGDLSVLYANEAALKNLEYSDGEMKRLKVVALFSFPDKMALTALLNTLVSSSTDHLDLRLKFTRKAGSHYDVDVTIRYLKEERVFVFVASDISAKLLTEKKLLESIREKDNLIKEIHHRVKNNLQLISSIIYLKLTSLKESEMRSFLEDTRQKIRSIALIHERLLQTEKLDNVDISDYLGKLIHDLQVTYQRADLQLNIETSLEKNLMSLDTAIICGLIVNELVTNSIKHAFRGKSEGKIAIRFFEEKDSTFRLVVADNGNGLPPDIEPGKTSSFGMQLLYVFARQLNGSWQIDRENGCKFQLNF
jgi:two-component sensor histidine kinase